MDIAKWLMDIIPSEELLGVRLRVRGSSRCILCRGVRGLCGKPVCPILVKIYSHLKYSDSIRKKELVGSSPGIFVGRVGYPKVNIGPLVPPFIGDTLEYDTPEYWINKQIQEIVDFRSVLVRGKMLMKVKEVNHKVAEQLREIALARRAVDVEARFKDFPRKTLLLDDFEQPYGPSAKLVAFKTGNAPWDPKLEKVYYDHDLKAKDAIIYLYNHNILVSKIQKALSIGALGLKFQRKFVPTRWSITAVDSIISQNLIEEIKQYPPIDEFRVYEYECFGNVFEILMLPRAWSYESMEAWHAGTLWNPGESIAIYGDFEDYYGRNEYASIGGCYYAARLAVTEALKRERRQATVIIFREVHPNYVMPVGVWLVRESVRRALEKEPLRFGELASALKRIASKLSINLERWFKVSSLLRKEIYQRRIGDYVGRAS
ncbi:MAG: Nre family DNA repair protein [Candidatus Nanoarchaeia archaeon]|nr:Nre family DNA repair protein [Candidatus Haiyanarchaeum thermophilum]MCW1308341.1 Nre family DNA repair protein [Candidatus Haiyanarchaeum thermophilum]MCW1309051.1 Nre family DNA repair protein [Candidatus Haiyanarchaeum thermophilum]